MSGDLGRVLADLGIHNLRETWPVFTTTRMPDGGWGVISTSWARWVCSCGFRADVDEAIPEHMIRGWHDEAIQSGSASRGEKAPQGHGTARPGPGCHPTQSDAPEGCCGHGCDDCERVRR